ncbi:MAG: DNA gyrase subunit A [Candidatus Lokiarchaeota archaeon]|nr:DNA gyrase subunit A [Candidatus Lokiarchaeota archaeon]
MSVVVGRAIPDVRDGLKPVHRRIIYAMHKNNWHFGSAHVKCAKVVGECFAKGTYVNTTNGLKFIENISTEDQVITHNNVKDVTQLYEMPEQELFKIELENGLTNICTKGQNFKTFSKNLDYRWKSPSELKIGDYIVCKPKYNESNDITYNYEFEINEDIAYFIGLFLADGWIDRDNKRGYHRIVIASESKQVINKVQEISRNYLKNDENIIFRETNNIYYFRINKHELNQSIIKNFKLGDKYSHNIKIPNFLKNTSKKIIYSFFSGYLEGDGHVHKNRNVINISSISEKFLRDFQIILFSLGINSTIYLNKKKTHHYKGRKIKPNYDLYSLEITGNDYAKIKREIHIYNPDKIKRLSKKLKYNPSKYDIIPFIGKYIFTEFSEKHLGGGWYTDKSGKKIRIGIKYPDGTKIRYQKDLKNKIKIYKSTIEKLNIKNKMELIGSKYLPIINEIIEQDFFFIKIKSINKYKAKKTYDIQVRDDHQFIANGMIVHNCLGNYHPHGDMAVYNSLVRMGQDFSLRYPLIDPQGNFGSVDGDPPAAYRYTEARLSKIANELIEDIQKETVDFQPNFDDSTTEPTSLPAKLPNILINGTKGIAVGMATSMPPHNIMEISLGIISTIDNPDISLEELIEIIKGPDFPTGGIITNPSGIYNAYATGQGNVTLMAKIEEEQKGKINNLIISEIPYLQNKAVLIESIAKLIRDGILKDIKDLRDESDRKGMRIVLELKKDAQPEIIKNVLFKRTRLLSSFSIVNLVLVNEGKQPKILNLKELIQEYIEHRLQIIYRRTEFDLKKAQDRLHKVEGLLIALDNIDEVVQIIKSSKDTEEAKTRLQERFEFTDIQVKAILNMTLSRLTNLETEKLKEEAKILKQDIKKYKQILAKKELRLEIIKNELNELIKIYGDKRKTEIIAQDEPAVREIERVDLIKKEPNIIIFSNDQYIKRVSLEEYRSQKRGGRGKKGMTVREEDFIKDLFVCSTHDTILFFTSKGRIYSKKAFQIPLQKRTAKGKPIVNIIKLQKGEEISEMIPINNFDTNEMLIMVTKKGIVKKISLSKFSKIQKTGIRAQKIRVDDKLISVKKITNELQDIFIATKQGYAIRFDESELRELGRTSMGVKGVDLRENDEVIDCLLVTNDEIVLTLTQNGYGQRAYIKEYRKTGRGAKGVHNIKLDRENNDQVIAIKMTVKDEDLLIGTEQGQLIRVPVDSIRLTHRKAKGVRVINLYEDDFVCAIGKCAKELEE